MANDVYITRTLQNSNLYRILLIKIETNLGRLNAHSLVKFSFLKGLQMVVEVLFVYLAQKTSCKINTLHCSSLQPWYTEILAVSYNAVKRQTSANSTRRFLKKLFLEQKHKYYFSFKSLNNPNDMCCVNYLRRFHMLCDIWCIHVADKISAYFFMVS